MQLLEHNKVIWLQLTVYLSILIFFLEPIELKDRLGAVPPHSCNT